MRRGAALLLVMILLAIGSSMALAFVSAQSTTLAITENLRKKSDARSRAELVLYATSRYLEAQTNWRNLLSEGDIVSDAMGVRLALHDGLDANDDGIVESDGDLLDDITEPVTLTATATVDGIQHTVSRTFWPALGGGGPSVLMIVGDKDNLTQQELLRQTFLYNHGYDVQPFSASSGTSAYSDALDAAEVVYVPSTASTAAIGTKLNEALIGIVSEAPGFADNLGVASATSASTNGDTILLTDVTHDILASFSTGNLQILTGTSTLLRHVASAGSDAASIATLTGDATILALETAGIRDDSSVTPARRVALPWGGGSFDFDTLNEDGQTILTQALDWAASGASRIGNARLLAFYNFIQGDPVPPQFLAHWAMDDDPPMTIASAYGVIIGDKITLHNGSSIDSYSSAAGAYGGSNRSQQAGVATNTTRQNGVTVNGGSIAGDLAVGHGANINSVTTFWNGGQVTGNISNLDQAKDVSPASDLTGVGPSAGSVSYNGGNHTLGADGTSSSYHFHSWTINNGATLTLHGDVRIQLDGGISVNSGSIQLAPGATAHIATRSHINIHNNSAINNDSTRTNDLTIETTTTHSNLTLNGGAIAAKIRIGNNITLNNNAQLYGTVQARNNLTINNGNIHIDADATTGTLQVPPFTVAESLANRDGQTAGSVTPQIEGFGDGGTSLEFNGSTDVIEVPHDSAFMIDRGAISLWFYPKDLSGKHGLISKDSQNYDNGGHFMLYTDGNRLRAMSQSNNHTYTLQSGNDLTVNTWHHAVFVFGAGGCQLFLDGNLVDSDAHTGAFGNGSGGSGNEEPWLIGACQEYTGNQTTSGWNDPFEGRIDDIRIYRTRLSSTQVADLFGGSDPTPESDPTLVEDRSGYGIPAHLYIKDPDRVSWLNGGGVEIHNATSIESPGVITKVSQAVTAAGQFSLVIDYQPGNLNSNADQDIVSYQSRNNSNSRENIEIEQRRARYNVKTKRYIGYRQVQTSDIVTGSRQVLVVTHDGTNLKFYVDGELQFTTSGGGAPVWYDEGGIGIGAEAYSYSEAFAGKVFRVAFYDGALSEQEIIGNYSTQTSEAGGTTLRPARWDWNELK